MVILSILKNKFLFVLDNLSFVIWLIANKNLFLLFLYVHIDSKSDKIISLFCFVKSKVVNLVINKTN